MMEQFENFERKPRSIEKLMDRFPDGAIIELQLSDLPADVLKHFEGKSSLYILPEDYASGNFHTLFLLSRVPGEKIYGAIQMKTYDKKGDPDINTEELVYIVDILNNKIAGYGEIRFNISKMNEYFKDKPFVGFTRTIDEFSGKNLGTKRLRTMNEITMALYNIPISSDTIITEPAKKVWEKLIENHMAEKFNEMGHERYRFIPASN